jgi:hypothetical protein
MDNLYILIINCSQNSGPNHKLKASTKLLTVYGKFQILKSVEERVLKRMLSSETEELPARRKKLRS